MELFFILSKIADKDIKTFMQSYERINIRKCAKGLNRNDLAEVKKDAKNMNLLI